MCAVACVDVVCRVRRLDRDLTTLVFVFVFVFVYVFVFVFVFFVWCSVLSLFRIVLELCATRRERVLYLPPPRVFCSCCVVVVVAVKDVLCCCSCCCCCCCCGAPGRADSIDNRCETLRNKTQMHYRNSKHQKTR